MERPPNSDAASDAKPCVAPEPPEEPRPEDDLVDEVIAESFPASDPPQWWAGPSK